MMKLKRTPPLWLISCLTLLLALTACTPDPNGEFIQGTWQIARPTSESQFFQWQFTNGTFTRELEIDSMTAFYTTGQYRIEESDGDLLILELFDFSGDRIAYENNPITIGIEMDRENDTAQIQNVLFVRALP